MQSKMWGAKVGVPKLLGIQLPLGKLHRGDGSEVGGGGSPQARKEAWSRNSQIPGHLGTSGSHGVGGLWAEDNDKPRMGEWELRLSSSGKVLSLVEVV